MKTNKKKNNNDSNTFQKESQIESSPNNKTKNINSSYSTNKAKDRFIVDWQMQEK